MAASHLQTLRAMAYNNGWANHRLLTACAKLTQAEFEAPRTGFFPSIQATLNHILFIDRFYVDALEGGALDLPYARMKGAAMMARDFDDASFRLALARKDADLVLAAASDAGLGLPVMSAIADRMRRAEQDGHGDEDMAATYWVTDPARG